MSEFNWDLNVIVKEILDEAKADKVDKQIRNQKEEWEEPVKIKVDADEAVKQLKEINAQTKNIKDNLSNNISSNKSFKDIERSVNSYKELKRRAEELYPVLSKNNQAYKENKQILKDTDNIIDKLTVSQKKLNKVQSDKTATNVVKAQTKAIEQEAKATEQAVNAQEKLNREMYALAKNRAALNKNSSTRDQLVANREYYSGIKDDVKLSSISQQEEKAESDYQKLLQQREDILSNITQIQRNNLGLTDKEIKQQKKLLILDDVIERYNKWMNRAGYEHLTIGTRFSEDTENYNLESMINEAKRTIDNENDMGEYNGDFSIRRPIINGLQRFINTYEPLLNLSMISEVFDAFDSLNSYEIDIWDSQNEQFINELYNERIDLIKQIGEEKLKAYDLDEYKVVQEINNDYLNRLKAFKESKDDAIYSKLDENYTYNNEIIESTKELESLLEKRESLMQDINLKTEDQYKEEENINQLIKNRITLMKEIDSLVSKGLISKNDIEDIVFEKGTLDEKKESLAGIHQDLFDLDSNDLDEAQLILDKYEKILVTTASGKKLELGPNMTEADYKSFMKIDTERAKHIEFIRKSTEQTTKSLEYQGKVYKTTLAPKDNLFTKNEHLKKLAVEATNNAIKEQNVLTREELISKAEELRWTSLSRDEILKQIESDPNFVNDLRAIQSLYSEELQPIKKIVSEISALSSIKGMGFDELQKSAVETAKTLSKMYDEGITDTKEYIALQYKLIKTIDEIGTFYGGLKGSGADSLSQLRQWIYNSIEDAQGYHIGQSSAIDAIYGQGDFSIYGDDGKLIPMRELAGDLINYKGFGSFPGRISVIEDYNILKMTNALLKEVDFVNKEREIKENAKVIKSYEELCSIVERYNELYEKDPVYGYDTRSSKEAKKYKNNFTNADEEFEFIELIARLEKTGADKWLTGYKSVLGNVPAKGLEKLAKDLGFITQPTVVGVTQPTTPKGITVNSVDTIKQITQEAEQFGKYFTENWKQINKSSSAFDLYNKLLVQVNTGAMSAADAINTLNNKLAENNTLMTKSGKTFKKGVLPNNVIFNKKDVSDSIDSDISQFLKGVDIKSITKGLKFGSDSQKVAQSMIVDYLTDVANATISQINGDDDKSVKSWEKATNKLANLENYFKKNGTYRDKNPVDVDIYEAFLDHLKKYPIGYNDDYKKEFTKDEWDSIINKYAKGQYPILTKNVNAKTADSVFGELKDSFGELFTDDIINEKDILRTILNTVEKGRQIISSGRKTIDIPISKEEIDYIGSKLTDATDKVSANVKTILSTERSITSEIGKQDDLTTSIANIRERNTDDALKQLRNAKGNKTPLIDLSGVLNTENVEDQLRNMANNAISSNGYTIDKIRVKDSVAVIKLYNDELKTAVTQTYQMSAASEEAESKLEFVSEAIEHNAKALREVKGFDVDFEQRFAKAQIDNLIQPLKGAKYEGEERLKNLANNIIDVESLKAFNNEMKIAQKEVSTFKKQLASDLDTTSKVSNTMLKAPGTIKSYRQEIEKFGNTKGVDTLTNSINEMEKALSDYSLTDKLEEQVEAFNKYDKAKKTFDSNIKSVRNTFQADQKAQKEEQGKIDAAWKNEFQNNYKYNNGKTAQDQTTLGAMGDYYKKQEQEAQAFNTNMKSIYKDLISTISKINTINTQMNELALKDGGTGLYSKSISNLEKQKNQLMASFASIQAEINNSLNIKPGENGLSKFFDIAREKAILTSAEIEKFDTLMMQAEKIGFDFSSKVTSKVQPTVEKLASLQQMISKGDINNTDIVKGVSNMMDTLSSKMVKFKESGLASDAMDAMNYADVISQNVAAIDKLAQKETQYFANKKKWTGEKFNDPPSTTLSTQVKSTEKELDSMQARLTKAAQEFTKGQAIITGFKKSADGISTLDFSVFDKGTNSLRQFSMEMGSMSNKIYNTEITVNKSAKSMQTALQQVSKMSSLLKTVELSGFDIAPETAHSSVTRLYTLMQKLNAAMMEGKPEAIDELSREAKIATSEVEKLLNESIKLQNAMSDKTAVNLGNYIDDNKITAYDQLSNAVRKHAADVDNATLSVGKFNEKQSTLAYTLTRGDGNVEHYTASINKLGKTISTQRTGVTKLKTGWQDLHSIISKSSKQMLMAFAGYNIFTQAIQTIRQGITYIKEIDSAMTELKKVTDETKASYAEFLNTASKDATKIGATTSDYVNAAANFARLGYAMDEAGNMGRSALVYKNVGDGLDNIEQATSSIISTMKAFGVQSNDTMSIVDKFNEVGNNFAITSVGIGDALERSASALYEGGNTLDESIGLITAAMKNWLFIQKCII